MESRQKEFKCICCQGVFEYDRTSCASNISPAIKQPSRGCANTNNPRSAGPSLHLNPNLLHVSTLWKQIQVQIQVPGLRNKHASSLNFGIESSDQPVLSTIAVLGEGRDVSQTTLLGEPKYHWRDLLACSSCLAAPGYLDRNLVWWLHTTRSPCSTMAQHRIFLISRMKELKLARTVRVK